MFLFASPIRKLPLLHPGSICSHRKAYMLSRRFLDFWLLGGASILVWLILLFGDLFRHDYGFVGQRYESLAAAFAVFTLICNHPHFMASYRMAYSRNRKFYFDHWLSLIALPVLFIGFLLMPMCKEIAHWPAKRRR